MEVMVETEENMMIMIRRNMTRKRANEIVHWATMKERTLLCGERSDAKCERNFKVYKIQYIRLHIPGRNNNEGSLDSIHPSRGCALRFYY